MLVLLRFSVNSKRFFFLTEYCAQPKRNTIFSSKRVILVVMPDATTSTLSVLPKTTLTHFFPSKVTNTATNGSINIDKAALRSKSRECAFEASSTSDINAVSQQLKSEHTSGSRWNAVVSIQRWYRRRLEGFYATRLLGILRLLEVEKRSNYFLLPEMQEEAAEILNTNWLTFWFACIDCVLQAGELYDYFLRKENQVRFFMVQELETTDCRWKDIDKLQRSRQQESCASLRHLHVLPESIWVEEVSTVVTSNFSAALKNLTENETQEKSNQDGEHINLQTEEKNAERAFCEMVQQIRTALKEKNSEWLMRRVHHCNSRGCKWSRFHPFSGCSALNDDKEMSFGCSGFTYQKPLHFVLQLLSNLSCPQYKGKTLSFIENSIQRIRNVNPLPLPPTFYALKTEEIIQEEEAHLHRPSSITSSSFTLRDDSPSTMEKNQKITGSSYFDPHQMHHEKQLYNDSCAGTSPSLSCGGAPWKRDSADGLTVPQHDLTSAAGTKCKCEPVELRQFDVPLEVGDDRAQDCRTPERFSQTRGESESNSDSMEDLLHSDEENNEENEEVFDTFDSVENKRYAQLNKNYFSSQEKRRMEVFSQIEQKMKFHPSTTAEPRENKGSNEFDTYDGEQVKEGIQQFGELKSDLQLIGFRSTDGGISIDQSNSVFFSNSTEPRAIAFSPCASSSPLYCAICEMEGFVLSSAKGVENGMNGDDGAFFGSSVQEIVEFKNIERMEPCHRCKRPVHLDCGVRYTENGSERETDGHNLLYCCSTCLLLGERSSRTPHF